MRRLILVLLLILITTAFAACRKEEEPILGMTFTPTKTAVPPTITSQPTFTPTIPTPTRPSPTPSQTPSITPTPLPTSTPTSTPLPDFYLTPSTPAAEAGQYRLVPWTADHADNLGRLMEDYQELIANIFFDTASKPRRFHAFIYPALAYREARLRFPNDPRADQWLVADLVNETNAWVENGERFQNVLVEALNAGEISLTSEDLTAWLNRYPSIFEIHLEEIPTLFGFETTQIFTISAPYDAGGMAALILKDKNGYSSRVIFSNLGDFAASQIEFEIQNLTYDDFPEVTVSYGYQSGTIRAGYVSVYEISNGIPVHLSIGNRRERVLSFEYNQFASVINIDGDQLGLGIHAAERFVCPASFDSEYRWNGQYFELIETTAQDFDQNPSFDNCYMALLTINGKDKSGTGELEREEVIRYLDFHFRDTLPTGVYWWTGEPFATDAQDEFRYLMAMNYATLGHVAEAQEFLNLILDVPSIPDSRWLEPAQMFLENYNQVEDVYRACLVAGQCDTVLSLDRAVRTLPMGDYENIIGRLSTLGATIHNSGTFDFDQDGSAETWAVLSGLPGEPLELWLFAETAEGIAAEFIADTTTLYPTFNYYTTPEDTTLNDLFWNVPSYDIIPFTTGTGDVYSFVRSPTTGQPFVDLLEPPRPVTPPEPPDPLVVEFDSAVSDLFAGANPLEIAERISAVINNPAFTPTNEHYYYLGLAYELAGDEPNAVAAYLMAWQNCCDEIPNAPDLTTPNPYAIMAQAKLELVE